MTDNYETPTITVLGKVADLTQAGSKPGIFFDMPMSAEGSQTQPGPGTPGTGLS